jgi:hypothetical protein
MLTYICRKNGSAALYDEDGNLAFCHCGFESYLTWRRLQGHGISPRFGYGFFEGGFIGRGQRNLGYPPARGEDQHTL